MKGPFMAHLGFAVLHLAPGEAVVAEGKKVALFIGTVFRLGGEAA